MKAKAEAEARAIRARAEAEAKAEVEAKARAKVEASQSSLAEEVPQAEQPPQQEPELKPMQSEAAEVEREFVGCILDFEIQAADGGDEVMHEEAIGSAEREQEEGGWEVLATADSRPCSTRGPGKGWWNIFF